MKDTKEIADADYAKQYTDWRIKTGGFARDITMRDHLAALAMQSLIVVYKDDKNLVCEYAERAYLIADAMLKERNK
jgi:hypothetical protein